MEAAARITKTKWSIDPVNSQIGFSVKYLLFSNTRGSFKAFAATVTTDENNFLTAEIVFSIVSSSIDTGNPLRDTHLKNEDFFDVEKFKEIKFASTMVKEISGETGFELYGNLTMKGIKKQIILQVESGGVIKDPWGSDKALFRINGKINRKDWGLDWNTVLETGGLLVSEDVWINCEVQLIKE